MSAEIPGPHGYLSCEDTQYSVKKYGGALRRIVDRGCIHCSAWETAAGALGLTFLKPEHVPNSEERLLDRVRAERDAARAAVLQLRDGWKVWCTKPEPDVESGSARMNEAMAFTANYEEFRA